MHKRFPGVHALRGVSMEVAPGEVHALVGENGAGKSTLIKIATGAQSPDSGSVLIGGEPVTQFSRAALGERGVRCLYQERQVVPDLTVAENVLLDELPVRRGLVSRRAMRTEARARLARLGIDLDPDGSVRRLSVAQLQLIEIARAVSLDARLVVMDEPTASLHRAEVERLFAVVRSMSDAGVAVLYISHHLDEIFEIAARVTVLRDGEVAGSAPVDELTSGDLVEMMFGRRIDDTRPDRRPVEGATTLHLDDVHLAGALRGIDLEVRSGEVLVATGGLGSGTSELARVAVGATRPDRGSVHLDGVGLVRSRRATASHAAFLPADRKRRGLLLDEPVSTNLTLGAVGAPGPPIVRPRRLRDLARRLQRLAGVRAANVDVKVRTLSGGNQQKVMVGRWLEHGSRLIVVDEPSAGIDIPSKFDIYETLRRLAADGAAVLVCTTDFQEVGQIADRVVVLRDGRIVAELPGAEASEHHLAELELTA
ncbi:MAG: sugar ABC transporter ATP-binding protein [Actinomycetota bacterium]